MILGLRQKMTELLVERKMYGPAKTEIEQILHVRNKKSYRISKQIKDWTQTEWYQQNNANRNNISLYRQNTLKAEGLLYADIAEQTIFVSHVNRDKNILHFMQSEQKQGFFKYHKHLKIARPGTLLNVRFHAESDGGFHKIHTARQVEDEAFLAQFVKEVAGTLSIPTGKNFGFIDKIYVAPPLIKKHQYSNGQFVEGKAVKAYDKNKGKWGWKLL